MPTGWNAVTGVENPDIIGSGYTQNGAGFAVLLTAQDGKQYLDMNGASPMGAITQTVSGLAAGSALNLTFWAGQFAQNSSGPLVASLLDATTLAVLGTTTLEFAYNPGATQGSWQQYSLGGVATSSAVVVRFDGDSGRTDRGAPALDNVALTASAAGAVPEPATWAMLVLGFGTLGAGLRRRNGSRGHRMAFA